MASSGFRDTTRLALSNTEMTADMVTLNNENIHRSLKSLHEKLSNILSNDYKTKVEDIKEFRKGLGLNK